ncbi:glycosyltransferase family 2 protein [Nitratidesulfovibrio liaohensis]|uniref:glycosyltransferase family 2 protein n=1 Tax=Nitratidesulfovibrio liaohensis TaxID=2604158 RepID=UPI00141F9DA4|nr:glycosyltransferase [Nitratidesulfovibrio liaohensis]NHZ47208.1 glycosyltransferase [Nitratidesulfovibrio liaohensis]
MNQDRHFHAAARDGHPLISVVVPSYNHGRYIGACLDALMFQDYPNLEIVITDDASTDDSVAVIRRFLRDVAGATASYACRYDAATDVIERAVHPRYARTGRRIVFLRAEANGGSTANYNRGLAHCTGEYCTFVPADDICHPQLFSALALPLRNDTADFAYADMFVVDDDMRILREFRLPEHSFDASFRSWYLCGVAKLYRRVLHDRFGPFDETADADDHECFLRFALGGARFTHVPYTLYSVRTHEGRENGLHAPGRFARLLEHSKRLTLMAREREPAPPGAWREEMVRTGAPGTDRTPDADADDAPHAACGSHPVAERVVLTYEERSFLTEGNGADTPPTPPPLPDGDEEASRG